MTYAISHPLIPAKAGTQIIGLGNQVRADVLQALRSVIWVPAFAGMSGV